MTTPAQRAAEKIDGPTEWLVAQCNRYVNGQCQTLRCLRRGGYDRHGGPVDLNLATCEAHEAIVALAKYTTERKECVRVMKEAIHCLMTDEDTTEVLTQLRELIGKMEG